MLDIQIKDQLRSVFAPLENSIRLVYAKSAHGQQQELVQMLEDLQSTSTKISVVASTQESPIPQFHIEYNGKPNGIYFQGIPGGHEFTSLVLAILNSDGKGKMPDQNMVARIRRLKGPVRLKTYISLTCENCPDVVQALNQMAILHNDFAHTMVDGGYVPQEIEALGIQGVPSVVSDKLIHSGRIAFLDLLAKLEAHFGVSSEELIVKPTDLGHFELVVIGGGPAGASAAIYSARKGLRTAVLAERIGGQVQDTKGIENFISVPYTEGPELSAQLYKHMKSYPIEIIEQRRVSAVQKGEKKRVEMEGGEFLTADTIIVATGAKWRELGIPGEKEYLGRGIAYCPHCDGPFYKGKNIAVVGGGNSGVEAAIDLAGIVSSVVVLEYNDSLKADKVLVDKLKSLPNARILTNAKTTQAIGDGQKITALEYLDRKTEQLVKLELDGVFVQIGLLPNSQFLKDTVELSKFGEIVIDAKGRSSEPGIYAAGDVTTIPYKQIIISMGEGAKVALAAFEDRMYKAK